MKRTRLWQLVLVAGLGCCAMALFSSLDVWGQSGVRGGVAGAKITRLDLGYVKSPTLNVTMPAGKGMSGTDSWLQLYALFSTQGGQGRDVEGKSTWHDEVTVEWAVMIMPRANNRTGKPILMRRTIVYVDVDDSRREHCADIYLRPGFLKRYCGATQLGRRDLKTFVRIKMNGQTVDSLSSDPADKTRWWEQEPPRVDIQENELLSRDETPYAAIDYDRYEQVKRAKGGN